MEHDQLILIRLLYCFLLTHPGCNDDNERLKLPGQSIYSYWRCHCQIGGCDNVDVDDNDDNPKPFITFSRAAESQSGARISARCDVMRWLIPSMLIPEQIMHSRTIFFVRNVRTSEPVGFITLSQQWPHNLDAGHYKYANKNVSVRRHRHKESHNFGAHVRTTVHRTEYYYECYQTQFICRLLSSL